MTSAKSVAAALLCVLLANCGQPSTRPAHEDAGEVAPQGLPAPAIDAPRAKETAPPVPQTAGLETPTPTPKPAPEPEPAAAPEPKAAPPPASPPPVPTQPAAFARCQGCHTTQPGADHGIGPNLAGVMGTKVGSRPGYAYSDAMAGFDQTWTPELMDAFLQNPRETVPGTKMAAAPVRDAETRRAIIDYLSEAR